MNVYRIVVDEWPTPDGKPWYRSYGPASYIRHYDEEAAEVPAWLAEVIGRSYADKDAWRVMTRVQYDDNDEIALVLMPKPNRVNYLSASGVSELAQNMRAFGAKVRIQRSKTVQWDEAA